MRILKVTQAYYPFLEKGGPTVKVRALARGLANRGHQVTVLTADLGFGARPVPGGEARRTGRGWEARQDGVEAVYLPTRARYRALTWNPGVFPFCRQRLSDFDLVHIYGLYDLLGPAVASSCHRLGLPYIVEPMGMFLPIVRSIRLKQIYHRLLGQKMLRGARYLVATAEQECRELIGGGMPETKIVVRRNGIELPMQLPAAGTFRRQWKIPPEKKLVLFLGRLVSKKSPELILQAFARWRREPGARRSALLVVAGPAERNDYRKKLETFSTQLGLKNDVVFTGPLYDDAKWAAYRDADVFVLPSQNENFGNTAAEAVACGTPVLVTDRCGIAPLVDQRAGLVVPHDEAALQEGLARLLEEDTLWRRLQAGCAEVTPALSWKEPLNEMEDLYRRLVAQVQPG